MSEFRIRAGWLGDVTSVIALERAVAEAPHWAEADYVAAVEDSGDFVRRCFFIAEAESALIGFAVGKVVGSVAELESVAVNLRSRRGGVGHALCEAVVEWGKKQGAAVVELEVRVGSEAAIGLYRGLGFGAVGRRPGYYSQPLEDAVLMRLDLMSGA